jgi:hypothetical protein
VDGRDTVPGSALQEASSDIPPAAANSDTAAAFEQIK